MLNVYFDRSLSEYLLRYCVKYKISPKVAINHASVWNAAEYYWKEIIEGGKDENLVTAVDLRIGCGGGQEPWTYFQKCGCDG